MSKNPSDQEFQQWADEIMDRFAGLDLRKAAENVAAHLDDLIDNFSVAVDFQPLVRAVNEKRKVGAAKYHEALNSSRYSATNGIFQAWLFYHHNDPPLQIQNPNID